jgi:hypothetical protein
MERNTNFAEETKWYTLEFIVLGFMNVWFNNSLSTYLCVTCFYSLIEELCVNWFDNVIEEWSSTITILWS